MLWLSPHIDRTSAASLFTQAFFWVRLNPAYPGVSSRASPRAACQRCSVFFASCLRLRRCASADGAVLSARLACCAHTRLPSSGCTRRVHSLKRSGTVSRSRSRRHGFEFLIMKIVDQDATALTAIAFAQASWQARRRRVPRPKSIDQKGCHLTLISWLVILTSRTVRGIRRTSKSSLARPELIMVPVTPACRAPPARASCSPPSRTS